MASPKIDFNPSNSQIDAFPPEMVSVDPNQSKWATEIFADAFGMGWKDYDAKIIFTWAKAYFFREGDQQSFLIACVRKVLWTFIPYY